MTVGASAPTGQAKQAHQTKENAMNKIFLLLLLAVGTSTTQASDQTIADAKAKIAVKMKDPESAKFADLVVIDSGKIPIVCGWVNAKNSYGGYVGYKPFFVMGKFAEVRDDASAGRLNNHIAFNGIWNTCSPSSGESFGTELVDLPKINIDRQCENLSKTLGKPLSYDCPKAENDAKLWLESHGTSSIISLKCSRATRNSNSYISGKSCVQDEEAEIIFSRGPKLEQAKQ